MYKTIAFILACCFMGHGLCSQSYVGKTYMGLSYYQGDLAPEESVWSYSEGEPAYGAFFGGKVGGPFLIGTRIIKGSLSADDRYADNVFRIRRNLHFRTDIYEVGLVTECNLADIVPAIKKYGVDLYLSMGANLFHFNPQAKFNDNWINLWPLSTEGQGLPQYPHREKYSLTDVSLSYGGGIEFKLSQFFKMGFEIMPRITYTDYLDDVSSSYIDDNVLLSEKGQLAWALANRTSELTGIKESTYDGQQRGDHTDKDSYFYMGVHVVFEFGADTLRK